MYCEKITYKTYKEAVNVIVGMSKHGRGKMAAYKCDECGGYHIKTLKNKILRPVKDTKYPLAVEQFKPAPVKKEPKQKKQKEFKPMPPITTGKLISKEQAEALKRIIQSH